MFHYGRFDKDNVIELGVNPNWLILILVTGKFSNIVLPVFGVPKRDSFLLWLSWKKNKIPELNSHLFVTWSSYTFEMMNVYFLFAIS